MTSCVSRRDDAQRAVARVRDQNPLARRKRAGGSQQQKNDECGDRFVHDGGNLLALLLQKRLFRPGVEAAITHLADQGHQITNLLICKHVAPGRHDGGRGRSPPPPWVMVRTMSSSENWAMSFPSVRLRGLTGSFLVLFTPLAVSLGAVALDAVPAEIPPARSRGLRAPPRLQAGARPPRRR